MVHTGDGTHATMAYIKHGCADPAFLVTELLQHLAETFPDAATVDVALGEWWGRKSKLLAPGSVLHAIVLHVQRHLTDRGFVVDLSRAPHIEVVKS